MKNKCNKIEQTCGSSNFAACIEYQGTTNENSPLKEHCALSLEETTQDIYNQLEEINLEELGESCLDYVETEDGKIIVKNVIIKFQEEICTLKQQLEDLQTISLCTTDITGCDFQWNGLVDSCGNSPTTLAEAIQLIIDTIQP